MTAKELAAAKAEVGIVPQVKEVFGRRTEQFQKRWQELAANKEMIKILEAENKKLTESLVEYFADSDHKTVMDGTTRITLGLGTHSSINKQLLLENGVTADTILASTKQTPYQFIVVTPAKDGGK